MKRAQKISTNVYLFLIYLFTYAPIVVLMMYSFNNSKSRGKFGGFTLKWYQQMFESDAIMSALWTTLTVAVLSAAIATVIGTVAAVSIHNMKKRSRGVVMNITYLPVLNPDIVTGVSLLLLFVFLNIKLGYVSMLLAHITFNIPYVILSVLPKLKQMNVSLYDAALDLGAHPVTAFFKVVLPEIMPGVVTGCLLAFTLSIDDFVISFFTAGAGVENLSIFIYNSTRKAINPSIYALSTLMFVTIFTLLLIVNRRTKQSES